MSRPIIGVDLSSRTGLVVLDLDAEDCNIPLVARELTTKLMVGFERLAWFRDTLRAVFKEYPPELVVLEGYSYSGKFVNHFQYEIGAIIRLLLYDMQIPTIEIPPTTLKSFVGNGKLSKELMVLEIFKQWGFGAATNNVADAYALAQVGLAVKSTKVVPKMKIVSLMKVESLVSYMVKNKLSFIREPTLAES